MPPTHLPTTETAEDYYRYTPQFCEENIWHLARKFRNTGLPVDRMFVLLFSNPNQSIVLCHQKKAASNQFVVWDYHVVLQVHLERADWIYDFDTRLPFPCRLTDYFSMTVPEQNILPEIYHTKIRQIPATAYLTRFCSDRSHMVGRVPADRFPEYPVIKTDASCSPIILSDYWDMTKELDDDSRVFEIEDYRGVQSPD